MANYKAVLKKLEEETKANTKEGIIREKDLRDGLADRIIEKHFEKSDKEWKVEFAKQLMKEKECNKASK